MMELVHNKALALANPSDNYMVVPDKGQDGNNANFTPVERPTATAVDFEKSGNNVVHESYSDLNNSTSTESVDERNSGENSDASITTVSESDRKCKNSVAMVGSKRPLDQSVVERKFDPCCKENVTNSVHIIKRKWMNVAPIHPALFLEKLLRTRGYDTSAIDAMLSKK